MPSIVSAIIDSPAGFKSLKALQISVKLLCLVKVPVRELALRAVAVFSLLASIGVGCKADRIGQGGKVRGIEEVHCCLCTLRAFFQSKSDPYLFDMFWRCSLCINCRVYFAHKCLVDFLDGWSLCLNSLDLPLETRKIEAAAEFNVVSTDRHTSLGVSS